MDLFIRVLLFIVFYGLTCHCWERELTCPLTCTCQLQHLSETAIYRFMQKDGTKPRETLIMENNEVIFDETLDTMDLLEEAHRNVVVRSATCILQTETDPMELIDSLSPNIESLAFIQGYKSGNKTIKFSWLSKFEKLLSLELIGPTIFRKELTNHLLCHIDFALENLNYLNLERVLVQNSKEQIQSFIEIMKESENITFEYVQKVDGNIHPLTIIQKGSTDDEVMPYEVFKQQRQDNGEIPLFTGFKKLLLLRIANCELNYIHWEMFDGLSELQYLLLERNNLTFIPAFAFYGTPNIKSLSLARNKLLDIDITDLAGLLQLEYLDLTYNNFTQLSELSFPPFPRLKLANFANNPIGVIFPNTFEVMNTTDSIKIGSEDVPLSLLPNSFAGLRMLKTLTVNNVNVYILQRDFFTGMPELKQMILTGNISKIEFDAFQEVTNLETLILSDCKIFNVSMDGFLGLKNLRYLDLSKNHLEYLPSGVFDNLENIQELYLNGNNLKTLPRDIFHGIQPKLLRLNDNPWHCSCDMSEWKPIISNRIKQKTFKSCDFSSDKGVGCNGVEKLDFKYVYNPKMSPKCAEPEQYKNWSVFYAMRKILKCADYKPKMKKHVVSFRNATTVSAGVKTTTTPPKMTRLRNQKLKKLRKTKYLEYKFKKHAILSNKINVEEFPHSGDMENDLNLLKGQSEETFNTNKIPIIES